jgi:hypothetical protein
MIIWLASYPRSGNTFLRTVMHSVFGIQTTSIPPETGDSPLASAIGNYDPGTCDLAALAADEKTHFVKTHELPADDSPAIYIIRDGRASIATYCHFLRGPGKYQAALPDLIMGRIGYGSWSRHVEAWTTRPNAKTLILQFDDLTAKTRELRPEIAAFCGLEAQDDRILSFEELHAKAPNHFRSGSSTDWQNLFTEEDEDLFWAMHGPVMEQFGLGGGDRVRSSAVRSLERIYGDLVETKASSVPAQRLNEMQGRLLALEKDCRDRLDANCRLATDLQMHTAGRQELLDANNRLAAELRLLDAGRQELLEANGRIWKELEALQKERESILEANGRLSTELQLFRQDREASLEANSRLAEELALLQTDRATLLESNQRLANDLAAAKLELGSRKTIIHKLFRRAG